MKTFEDQWERLRKKGKMKYMIINGALLWGLPMSLVIMIYFHFKRDLPWTPTIFYLVPTFLVGGFIFGFIMWTILEKCYQDRMKR